MSDNFPEINQRGNVNYLARRAKVCPGVYWQVERQRFKKHHWQPYNPQNGGFSFVCQFTSEGLLSRS